MNADWIEHYANLEQLETDLEIKYQGEGWYIKDGPKPISGPKHQDKPAHWSADTALIVKSNNGYEVYVWNDRDPREQLKRFLALPQITIPGILVESDYDGYFEALVRKWCATKATPFKSKRIVITAGPYRQDAVTAKRDGETLHLDFYSAIRTGFGNLSDKEVETIKDEWL